MLIMIYSALMIIVPYIVANAYIIICEYCISVLNLASLPSSTFVTKTAPRYHVTKSNLLSLYQNVLLIF